MKKLLLALAVTSLTACGGSESGTDENQSPDINIAPIASNLMITNEHENDVVAGDTLSLSYEFADAENDIEAESIIAWYRAGLDDEYELITDATAINYTLTVDDIAKNIRASIIPVAQTGSLQGELAYSSNILVSDNTPPNAVNLSIISNQGEAVIASMLTAEYSFTDNQRDAEGQSLYRWILIEGDSETELSQQQSLRIPVEALSKKIAFEVTPIASTGVKQGETIRSAAIDIQTEQVLFTANQDVIIDIMSGLTAEQSHLYITDGTEEGTLLLANLDGIEITKPVVLGDLWIFTRKTADNKVQLMVSDGTPSGTLPLLGASNELVNLNPKNLAIANGLVYFSGYDSTHGQELWSTDGTNANTQLVSDIKPGTGSSDPVGMIWLEDAVYVSADGVKSDGSSAGRELFFIDGNSAVLVKDINPNGSSYPFYLTFFNDKLYFQAWDGETGAEGGNELWSSDGGFHGTNRVKDLYPANHSYPANFTVVGDDLYFTTSTTNDPHYGELWKTRGLAENTVEVGRTYHQQAGKLTAFADKLIYSAAVPDQAEIPWSAIATSDTHTDLTSLDSAKSPGLPVVLGNEIYFKSVGSSGKDYELYSASAEDMSSPRLRAEINANGSSNPTDLIKLNGLILFTADDGDNGRELWRFDGSEASIVKELISGAESSSVNLNLPLFFMMGEF